MARDLTSAPNIRDAIDIDGSYYPHIKAEVYPSRVYFETVTDNNPITSPTPDALGLPTDPVRQDIEYNSTQDKLMTYFAYSGSLYYAIQGTGGQTALSGAPSSSVKPGVLGSKMYIYNGTTIVRYSLSSNGTSVSSDGASITPTATVDVVHAVSATEAIGIEEDESGFRPVYMSGSSMSECPIRFMFHIAIEPTPKTDEEIREGKTDDTRTMIQKAIHSGAAKLGTKVFVYMTNAFSGMVEGIYYDTDTSLWSDIFVTLPTDLQVSQCEFRVSNVYEHNGSLYMCGQFDRTDNLTGTEPYSLLLFSVNGRTFSINRNTLVSNIGYRFLARVGDDDHLYLAGCNRVCYEDITWVFDGINGTAGVKTEISEDDVKGYSDSDLSRSTLTLRSGLEKYFPETTPNMIQGARLIVWAGLTCASSIEWVKYATYIIDSINYGIGVGSRETSISATNEALWNLSGLSMPFYAEILGKSCIFDPLLQDSSTLSSAGNGCIARTSFQVDFWDHEAYSDDTQTPDLIGVDMNEQGGVNYHEVTGGHYLGLMTREELYIKCMLNSNPEITATSVTAKVYGWSHTPPSGGSVNDEIRLILLTADDEDTETTTIFTTTNNHFPNTYDTPAAGYEPVEFTCTGLTVGHTIKKVGVAFYTASASTWFNIARVEFTAGVMVYFPVYGTDTPWEALKDGSYKVPRAGKPYVMVSRGPYNAFDFSLAARFKNTIDDAGAIASTYPAACGLVGHCEDGMNYTVGRYNRQTDTAELVVCREGIETTLLSTALTFTVNDTLQMRFDHRGGHFDIYIFDDAVGYHKKVLGAAGAGYDWETADSYMYTSDKVTMRCGIYGFIGTPIARILGYYDSGDESDMSADGIPFDPLWSTADFPSNGTVTIMDNEYEYYSKVAHPALPRGPYQFRQMDDYTAAGLSENPDGEGYGLDARDFDHTGEADHNTLNNGYLVAINSGANYKCSDTEWQVYTITGGSQVPLRNRMRYYSLNTMIGKLYHSLSNKVWIVGGLLADFTDPDAPIRIRMSAGTKTTHYEGDFVTYKLAGEMLCYWYMGAGGEDETTVGNMVQRICDLSGARCSFPSDYIDASEVITTSPANIHTTDYAEGLDLSFDIASFSSSNSVSLWINAKLNPDNYENKDVIDEDTDLELEIYNLGSGSYRYSLISQPSDTVMYSSGFTANTGTQKFRIAWLTDNVGIYQNGQWVTTITTDEIEYEKTLTVTLVASTSTTLTNIKLSDLGDWREAVWIDLETDGTSALGSVIQQRPIEMFAKPNGSLVFWYEPTRSTITAVREPRQHRYTFTLPYNGASDAIVYGLKDVKTLQNTGFARELGFATRMMRMPDLGMGAMRAAHIVLQRLLESFHKHQLVIRPDLELEPGDIYICAYTAAGTGREEDRSVIVESVSFDYRVSGTKTMSSMAVQGREVYE
jgi:hypothetical protein